jgi:hypothetical protein
MNKVNGRKSWLFLVLILIVILSYYAGRDYLRSLPKNYGIAEITEIYFPLKTGAEAIFSYVVAGKEFHGSLRTKYFEEEPKVGMFYIVEFPEAFNGRFGRLCPDLKVKDKSIVQPNEGWDELPEDIQ